MSAAIVAAPSIGISSEVFPFIIMQISVSSAAAAEAISPKTYFSLTYCRFDTGIAAQ